MELALFQRSDLNQVEELSNGSCDIFRGDSVVDVGDEFVELSGRCVGHRVVEVVDVVDVVGVDRSPFQGTDEWK
jgi:hypothetical protein